MNGSDHSTSYPFSKLETPDLESLNQLQAAFREDERLHKVDLMVGSYRSDSGEQTGLKSVQLAKAKLYADPKWNHEYPSSHLGEMPFRQESMKILFGTDNAELISRIASMQALGGSGACHMGAVFLKKYYYPLELTNVFIPADSWANHPNIFRSVGFETANLPYFDKESRTISIGKLLEFVELVPERSIIVLQVCGNNPTGCDPNEKDWTRLARIMQRRKLFAFLDVAYQGFVSGDVEQDLAAIRIFAACDVSFLVAATYGKAFGLYGERVGHLCIITPDANTRSIVEDHMKLIARSETGAQPRFGALIVSTILSNHELSVIWREEISNMATNLQNRRTSLLKALQASKTGDWAFVTKQRGMFLYTGLNEEQIIKLREVYAVYLQDTGRISVAGLTASNIPWVAKSLLAVTEL